MDFDTAQFRMLAALLAQRIDRVMLEAVAHVEEPAWEHSRRVGFVQGLRAALDDMREIERQLLG